MESRWQLDDGTLVYRVADTGIGIPPDKIGSLFTEFKQTDATIASEYGGTGLGLSITKKFIEMHGGRIWVESEPGKGSTFIFEVPLRRGGDMSAKTILYVEDNEMNRKIVRDLLKRTTYTLIEAHDGEAGVAKALEIRPDLILMDIQLPKISGLEAMRRLRAEPRDREHADHRDHLVCALRRRPEGEGGGSDGVPREALQPARPPHPDPKDTSRSLSPFAGDLPSAISNAVTLIRERAMRHGIALGVDIDPRLGEFQADERKVKQILLNLLSNAVKFTPDGGRVDVAAKLDADAVEIAVKDTASA